MDSDLENLPSVYKEAAMKLEADLKAAENLNDATKIRIIKKFSKKYWLLPKYWQKYDYNGQSFGVAVTEKSFENYHKNIEWKDVGYLRFYCEDNGIEAVEEAIKHLDVPCWALNRIYKIVQCYSTQPLSGDLNEKHRHSFYLRKELKQNWSNFEAWFKTLQKFKDHDLIIANFEFRFLNMEYCSDKKMWKSYIEFLKIQDFEKMLIVYKHYTRFFIEDKEMVEEYRKEIEEGVGAKLLHPISKWLIDTIRWEMDFGNIEKALLLAENAIKRNAASVCVSKKARKKLIKLLIICNQSIQQSEKSKTDLMISLSTKMKIQKMEEKMEKSSSSNDDAEQKEIKCSKFWTNSEMIKQNFDFPSPMMAYALKNSKSAVLQNLHKSCKYFFEKSRLPLCYRLVIGGNETKYFQQSLQISDDDFKKVQFQELIKKLKIINLIQWRLKEYNNFLKIYKNLNVAKLNFLHLNTDRIPWDTYFYMIKSTYGKLNLQIRGDILDADGSKMTIDDILKNIKENCPEVLNTYLVE